MFSVRGGLRAMVQFVFQQDFARLTTTLIYNRTQKSCATCGIRLKPGNHRPCQQPVIIQAHLRENTGFQVEICGSDPVHVC